ncbi:hypothetical protein QBC32DRAFT_327016 [Pseudoneurospora amorphoporcata]|uniref:Uncharacterized protein n=1 Tax=Pseudoneurospora amorphoporcata TaxID=241081 RepID=A0AAN6SDP7_9PEZI|nr:hypothetical protein QBC32DRAFT_327016 [Pseudoneurospora amorphoporcata]
MTTKPLPDLTIPWSETEGITFRALLHEITPNTNTNTNPITPSPYPEPSSSSAAQEVLPTVEDSYSPPPPPAPLRPWPLLANANLTKPKPKPQHQGQSVEDLGLGGGDIPPLPPLSAFQVVLSVASRKPVEAFHRGLREGIRRQVLEYHAGLEEAKRERERLRKVGMREEREREMERRGMRGMRKEGRWTHHQAVEVDDDPFDDDISDDDDDATLSVIDAEGYYQRALLEGWQVYLEKVQIRWEDNNITASSEKHNPTVVTLPVDLLDKGRTDEELDRYLQMMHLRGYRDLVEISFRWAKEGRPQKPGCDGEKGQSCIVIDDE